VTVTDTGEVKLPFAAEKLGGLTANAGSCANNIVCSIDIIIAAINIVLFLGLIVHDAQNFLNLHSISLA